MCDRRGRAVLRMRSSHCSVASSSCGLQGWGTIESCAAAGPGQQAATAASELQLQLQPQPPQQQLRAPQQLKPLAAAAKAVDPDDLAALPGLNDAQRLMFQAFGVSAVIRVPINGQSRSVDGTICWTTAGARFLALMQRVQVTNSCASAVQHRIRGHFIQ